MKKIIILIGLSLILSNLALAENKCFIAVENGQVIKQEGGECGKRYSPESTFKIVLSLIGFDSGILQDESSPEWPCKSEYDYYINICKGPHTPKTWMRDSCLWYSRVLTRELGLQELKNYVERFNYGNKEIGGENPLSDSWISSTLQISPVEQIEFLDLFVKKKLPVKSWVFDMTKKIMFHQELPGGWKLYGKTGNGKLLDKNGKKTEIQHGWFVGWIEKDDRIILFANHLADDKCHDTFASLRGKSEALIKIWYLLNGLSR